MYLFFVYVLFSIDFGIFTIKLMGWCPDARIGYAVDLMFSHYNTFDDEKKRVKEFCL